MQTSTRTPVVIFGIGTLASVVGGYLGDRVHAYTVDGTYITDGFNFNGKPIVPFKELYHIYPPSDVQLLFAVTQQNGHRDLLRRKCSQARDIGYTMASFIHPTAFIGNDVQMDEGVLVSPHVIVEDNTALGYCSIIRTGAYIGHHCVIGNYVYVAPRASMSGHTTVKAGAFIGNNATLRDRITIGDNAIIGAGAVVLRDVKENEVYKAMEARLLSTDARKIKI